PQPLVVIAGDGPEKQHLQDRIEAEALPVRLLGHRSDMSDLFAAADVAVLTSTWEARALVAQEALRAGVPLVATAVGGVPELVGDAALLVPRGESAAVAAQVSAVLDDAELAERLRTAGRKRAATWPDEDDTVAQVRTVYGELTNR
ncbi:MAG TPA: glycosyltransferase, partial [Actinomycetes bacterium]|nr:glycosyltransferase [Actinomycetes bacterium]